ncbi:MAG TPA: D-alanyl-D-alanine carboxypeptidase family protein [Clostridia bacterium]|nr:D-alanyl-D-alanine carboxypeptidase family protein [Clostridia bacterium]
MDIFSRHELIKVNDGYTLVLHVDKQTSEFAEDFFSMLDSKRKELQKGTLDYIRNYINENYRDTKIDTVNIMLGSLLIASIAYSPVAAAYSPSALPARKVQVQTSTMYIVKAGDTLYGISKKTGTTVDLLKKLNSLINNTIYPGQQLKTQDPKDNSVSKPPAVTTNNLILVNKTHNLPAGYVPKSLAAPKVSSANTSKTMMTPEAAEALEALFARAKQENIKLTAISGYRSYERQSSIFASNINKYGSATAANQFSARPGQSEHQTGLAMDVSSPSVNFTLTQSYAQTREGKWLKDNAPKYGFIVRYTKGKEHITGYQSEPWHIRYVGKNASLEIASRNITLEEFLGKI